MITNWFKVVRLCDSVGQPQRTSQSVVILSHALARKVPKVQTGNQTFLYMSNHS